MRSNGWREERERDGLFSGCASVSLFFQFGATVDTMPSSPLFVGPFYILVLQFWFYVWQLHFYENYSCIFFFFFLLPRPKWWPPWPPSLFLYTRRQLTFTAAAAARSAFQPLVKHQRAQKCLLNGGAMPASERWVSGQLKWQWPQYRRLKRLEKKKMLKHGN